MTRDYARSPQGERAYDHVPRNRGTIVTMLGALTLSGGLDNLMTVEGATTAEVFESYLEQVLLKRMLPGDTIVLDNLGAHRTIRVRTLCHNAGVRLKYLPPYSPELNPIELAWSKLKPLLKKSKARTREALDEAIAAAIPSITADDALNWARHCAYPIAQPT